MFCFIQGGGGDAFAAVRNRRLNRGFEQACGDQAERKKAVGSTPGKPGNRRRGAHKVEFEMLTKKVVLDCGTIPNAAAIGRLAGPPLVRDGFLSWALHELACVSVLTVTRERISAPTFALSSFSRETLTEATLVNRVERILDDRIENLVTFNGRAFDLPLLQLRSIANGCITPSLRALTAPRGPRPGVMHVDLLDRLCPAMAAPKVRLADVCAALSIPTKADVAGGAAIAALASENRWDRIQQFCEFDVLSTGLLQPSLDVQYPDDLRALEAGWSALASWIASDPGYAGGDDNSLVGRPCCLGGCVDHERNVGA